MTIKKLTIRICHRVDDNGNPLDFSHVYISGPLMEMAIHLFAEEIQVFEHHAPSGKGKGDDEARA